MPSGPNEAIGKEVVGVGQTDSAADYALAAMDKATSLRSSATTTPARRGPGGSVGELPSLDFAFRSPSFLSGRSRWALFGVLAAAGFVALALSYAMVTQAPQGHGAEWIAPPLMALVVAAIAFALAYATVMGFGDVEIKTAVGGGQPSGDTGADGGSEGAMPTAASGPGPRARRSAGPLPTDAT